MAQSDTVPVYSPVHRIGSELTMALVSLELTGIRRESSLLAPIKVILRRTHQWDHFHLKAGRLTEKKQHSGG